MRTTALHQMVRNAHTERALLQVDYWIRANCPGACDIGGCIVVHDEKKNKVSEVHQCDVACHAGAVC